ncbi:hypothetical protein L3X38_012114 [Prunus dulcis]|uniref:Uncharacterized protein n=1 Tax=Prunus dulcis TaxID=3755 RepID=A0AAD4WLH7_PRUDU|nr:hypothetical protein L3X38_012114 [Prunus dulcis]
MVDFKISQSMFVGGRPLMEDSISPSALPLHSIVFDAVASLLHQFEILAMAARTPPASLPVPNTSVVPVILALNDPIFQAPFIAPQDSITYNPLDLMSIIQFSARHSPKKGLRRPKK